ncbi:hypothetical protein [Leptospira sp. GIMC2001]|uniref:hypothetical protein n=1 Tax=Leptospira sp. GIMC2001 TaxID=1513297 RepID=UPI00234BC9E6|nr:hypothetical protein [Leptospira sp. GIMC2001]WCL51445.1 hypothetical protein O4O04_20225 [Leptospira sp. GIMC2001]
MSVAEIIEDQFDKSKTWSVSVQDLPEEFVSFHARRIAEFTNRNPREKVVELIKKIKKYRPEIQFEFSKFPQEIKSRALEAYLRGES